MTRPAFRVFVTHHHGGLISTVLLRRHRVLFDKPPPAAMATTVEDSLARLAPQAALLADDGNAERYLWTEELEMRRVEVDIHPGRPDERGYVIAKSTVPIRLGYAAAKLDDADLYRVIVPRFDWTFVTEDLKSVPDTIRSLVFTALIGDQAASLYDVRREKSEEIIEWSPLEASALVKGKKAVTRAVEPVMEAVAEDWVDLARNRRLRPSVGIDNLFQTQIAYRLTNTTAQSMLLVGPRGAGKTTLVRRMARYMLDQSRAKPPRSRSLWATSADRIIAGMVYLGMWQQRCLDIAAKLDDGDFLYVDRLADLMQPQSDGASIAELFGPHIIAGEMVMIAECDEDELVRARQKYPALVDAMSVIRVPEASTADTVALLEPYGQRLSPPIALDNDASRRLVELLGAFRRDTAFPGKALAFLDGVAARHARSKTPVVLDARTLVDAFAEWSGLPVDLLSPDRALDTPTIATALAAGVIGQPEACTVAARVIARLKAGLDDPQRPVGTLLFAGPTGVGKTELAKQLARYLFGDADRLVRIDMSELTTGNAIARLITPSPSGTSLADRIRRQPLSVVLFDEIEKAADAAFDLLLGVVGEGRLTDALGRLVDFRMAVIVMTTNLGAADPRPAGFSSTPDAPPDPNAAIRNFFRPELIGRIDSVLAFRPLSAASLEKIVELELAKLRSRPGLISRNLRLEMTPAARTRLAQLGHDPRLGARPLRRTIEDLVVAPLAERMARSPSWRDATVRIGTEADADIVV